MKMHLRDRRLFVNAGMSFPTCYANRGELLDTDKCHLPSTGLPADVTCKNCLRIANDNYR
jgi:hypothetical protein